MRASDLHKVAKLLREIAMDASTEPEEERVSAHELAIIEHVARHPGSSIRDIVDGTGVAQSMVSQAVSHLREREVLHTEKDPADGRRVLVQISADIRSKFPDRGGRAVSPSLAARLPGLEPEQHARVEELLEELARLILPPR